MEAITPCPRFRHPCLLPVYEVAGTKFRGLTRLQNSCLLTYKQLALMSSISKFYFFLFFNQLTAGVRM